AAGAGRRLRLAAHRTVGSEGPDSHAQGQIWRFYADYAFKKLSPAGAGLCRLRGRRTGAAGGSAAGSQRYQTARIGPSFDGRGSGVRAPAAGTRNLIIFLLYN